MRRVFLMGAILGTAAATAWTADDWEKNASSLRSALLGSSVKKLEDAITLVAQDDSERAAKLLLDQMAKAGSRVYWRLIAGLSRVTTKEAVGPIVKHILGSKDPALRRDLLMAFQLNLAPSADDGLLQIMAEGTPELKVIAMDELVKRGAKKAVAPLIDLLDKEEKPDVGTRAQALRALRRLTNVDHGPAAAAWRTWWKGGEDAFDGEAAPKTAGPGATVVETLQRNRLSDYENLKKGAPDDIVVVAGFYDEVQKVLEKMAIPHTLVTKADFPRRDLSKTGVLLVNCDDYTRERFPRQQVTRIRDFVAGGGFLFTSDWGLVEVLEVAFPGYCRKGPPMEEGAVEIFPRKGSTGHPLLRDVFVKAAAEGAEVQTREKLDFRWVIDVGTFSTDCDPSKVAVLIESPELAALYGQGAVAMTFPFGDARKTAGKPATPSGGRVLHVLSHFIKQKTKNDEFAIQNMLLNFLIEAADRRAGLQRK
ncbi:MAG TPA: HEAT repeat domain-containing protein [Planctomycetota bacterium]